MDEIRIGSPEHKRLFWNVFMETHDPFKPMDIVWPEVDDETRERLSPEARAV
jgi:hypothetical protein